MLKRVIISGGGTGGHIFPAVAIANEIRKRNPESEILFVGALGRMEMEKVPEAGYEIMGLPIAGIQRKLSFSNVMVPFKLYKSIRMAKRIIREFKPECVVGVGGYASAATLYAASKLKVPVLIQEQNSYAGITNKWLSSKASKICVAYDGMQKFFPADKIVFTGNPVRDVIEEALNTDISEAKRSLGFDSSKPLVLVIGGSLGARTINLSIQYDVESLASKGIQLYWQTGKHFNADTKGQKAVKSAVFISDMKTAYAAADLVVSRAGALSVSELCLLHKPCILVPSPNVAEDHQTKNAQALSNQHAAVLIKDIEAGSKLTDEIIRLIENEEERKELGRQIEKLAKPHALKDIVDTIESIA